MRGALRLPHRRRLAPPRLQPLRTSFPADRLGFLARARTVYGALDADPAGRVQPAASGPCWGTASSPSPCRRAATSTTWGSGRPGRRSPPAGGLGSPPPAATAPTTGDEGQGDPRGLPPRPVPARGRRRAGGSRSSRPARTRRPSARRRTSCALPPRAVLPGAGRDLRRPLVPRPRGERGHAPAPGGAARRGLPAGALRRLDADEIPGLDPARAPDERVAACALVLRAPVPPAPHLRRRRRGRRPPPARAQADPLLGVLAAALGSVPGWRAWRNSSSARPRTTGAAPTPGWPSSTPWPGSSARGAGPGDRPGDAPAGLRLAAGHPGCRRTPGTRPATGRAWPCWRPPGARPARRCGRWPASAPGASAPSTTCASCRRSSVASPTWPSSGWRSSPRPALPSGRRAACASWRPPTDSTAWPPATAWWPAPSLPSGEETEDRTLCSLAPLGDRTPLPFGLLAGARATSSTRGNWPACGTSRRRGRTSPRGAHQAPASASPSRATSRGAAHRRVRPARTGRARLPPEELLRRHLLLVAKTRPGKSTSSCASSATSWRRPDPASGAGGPASSWSTRTATWPWPPSGSSRPTGATAPSSSTSPRRSAPSA